MDIETTPLSQDHPKDALLRLNPHDPALSVDLALTIDDIDDIGNALTQLKRQLLRTQAPDQEDPDDD